MTTRDPGASEVFTQGLARSPRATAARASRPAATMTWGFDVFVQLVMAAITTSPSCIWWWGAAAGAVAALCTPRSRATWKDSLAVVSGTRSCGREGPASDGTTSPRSSVTSSEYTGSGALGSCQRPCALA